MHVTDKEHLSFRIILVVLYTLAFSEIHHPNPEHKPIPAFGSLSTDAGTVRFFVNVESFRFVLVAVLKASRQTPSVYLLLLSLLMDGLMKTRGNLACGRAECHPLPLAAD